MHTQMKSNKHAGNYTQQHFCVEQKAANEWKLANFKDVRGRRNVKIMPL